MTQNLPDPATHVPPDEEPTAVCAHCEQPFRSVHARDLHVGEVHGDDATETERERYERAIETERDDLWFFHARTVVALGVVYSTTVILYMVVLGQFG